MPHEGVLPAPIVHHIHGAQFAQVALVPLTPDSCALVSAQDAEAVRGMRWRRTSRGYADTRILVGDKLRYVMMHRFILGLGAGHICDHANGDRLDNRRENLRVATPSENARNGKKKSSGTASRFKGVSSTRHSKHRLPWMARIVVNNKILWLGTFATEEEAARAYNSAASRLHGEFARLNEVPSP